MSSLPTGPERPIQTSTEDQLERSRFIERLTSALVNPDTEKSTGLVVGIAGPWGSGKSSILNLLREHIQLKYEEALVVRFDPWLVSGRDDIIAEFLGELIGTINSDQRRSEKLKKLGTTLAQYGAQLSPVGNLLIPGFGSIVSGGFKAMEKALSKKESLSGLRGKLVEELEDVSLPIVVLIDEIDRVEDNEIRTVAQLVRSVADFPGISYVLAYDPERVIQALGAGVSEKERDARGRGYLEKIVQLQIPLPATFPEEIVRLLSADLRALRAELKLPNNFEGDGRYQILTELLASHTIQTLRDTRRLVGTFHVLSNMLYGEVDWIDLLAYSALLIKSPETVTKMRRSPEDFLSRGSWRRPGSEDVSGDRWFESVVPESERNEATKEVLRFLFPRTFENYDPSPHHIDGLHERRTLLTTLRLGLLPGAFSRDEVRSLLKSAPRRVRTLLRKAHGQGRLTELIDRLDELYVEIGPSDHTRFWEGVAGFAKKPHCRWSNSYQPVVEDIRSLAGILPHAVRKDPGLRKLASSVLANLQGANESELVAYWLRTHIFVHGLFGHEQRGGEEWFFDAEQTRELAVEMSQIWRMQHLKRELLPCRWDVQPIYTMIDTKVWDEACRNVLNDTLRDDSALDGFTLMLFGRGFTVEPTTIGKMLDYDTYLERLRARMNSEKFDRLHRSVQGVLRRALGDT
jgi:hypothetical protein